MKRSLKRKRILFIGSTERGYLSLKALIESGANISGIISLEQDAHEVNNYQKKIATLADNKSVKFRQAKSFRGKDILQWITEQVRPDVAIVIGCRVIIPKAVYQFPRLGAFGIHDSLLPNFRGFAPLNWAMICGEKVTGVTLFKLNHATDEGDIYAQYKIAISPDETATTLYSKVCKMTVKMILENLLDLERGKLKGRSQKGMLASYGCPRIPQDGLVDWSQTTEQIWNLIRGLTDPYPKTFFIYKNSRIYIHQASIVDKQFDYRGRIPGRPVARSASKGTLDVLTADGIIRLEKLEGEDGLVVNASQIVKSLKVDLNFSHLSMLERIRVLEKKLQI